jgi:hypothetical protein
VPRNENKVLYAGPDVHNECFDVQPGDVDVVAVASNRRHLSDPTHSAPVSEHLPPVERFDGTTRDLDLEAIVPGSGWQLKDEYPGDCDGTYDAICGRHRTHQCPLIGHHDSRGFLVGNEFSGWLVMEVPEVKEGIILLKIITWYTESENDVTKGWSAVNNGHRGLKHRESGANETDYIDGFSATSRRLDIKSLPDGFHFDYAINGKITSLDKAAFSLKVKQVQRVVEVITLLDDTVLGRQEKVEVAIRMRGCGRACTFGVTHLYWA